MGGEGRGRREEKGVGWEERGSRIRGRIKPAYPILLQSTTGKRVCESELKYFDWNWNSNFGSKGPFSLKLIWERNDRGKGFCSATAWC
jgi:hypothetical protein